MSPYFESIRIQHRQIHLLPYHTDRLNRTRRDIFGAKTPIDLKIKMPDHVDEGTWKCKVVYGMAVEQVTFDPYPGRQISSFKLIDGGSDIDYTYKGDRTQLRALYDLRGKHDDIIIVKDGYVTDSFWSNLLLSQDGRWYTPANPLLRGTMRQYLLDTGMITERIILADSIDTYDHIMSINALNPFDLNRAVELIQVEVA